MIPCKYAPKNSMIDRLPCIINKYRIQDLEKNQVYGKKMVVLKGFLTISLRFRYLSSLSSIPDNYNSNVSEYKIPIIENLGATLDQFDTINFTNNEIRKIDNFPLLPRLKSLIFNNNRIV